jgi:hypothetical protein
MIVPAAKRYFPSVPAVEQAGPSQSDSAPSGEYPPNGAPGQIRTERRHDAPPLLSYSRGSRDLALAIASDPGRMAVAVDEFNKAAKSKGHAKVVSIQLELWDAITSVHSGSSEIRLTTDSYTKTIAVLKKAGYRSAVSIASAAKLRHVEAGHEWTQALFSDRSKVSETWHGPRRAYDGVPPRGSSRPQDRKGTVHTSRTNVERENDRYRMLVAPPGSRAF